LPEQNLDLIRGTCACDSASYESPRRMRLPYFGLRTLGVALSKAVRPLALVYSGRFREMRRDEESIQRNRQLGNAYSQLGRQTAK